MSIQEQVRAFHTAMGVETLSKPGIPSDDVVRLRLRLIAEEFFETLDACRVRSHEIGELYSGVMWEIDHADLRVDLPAFADGLADTAYVVEGCAQAFGIDSAGVLAEVQRANMAKVGGPIRADGKRGKPPGWTPPDIEAELKRQGGI